MNMTHAECQDLLLDLAYGELDPARAAEVELHLAGCAECRGEQAKLAGTRTAFAPILSSSAVEEPGPAFDAPILAAARAAAAASRAPKLAAPSPAAPRPPRKLRWMRASVIGSIAAAAALAIIVSTGKTDKVIGEPPRSPEERIAQKGGAAAKKSLSPATAASVPPAQAQALPPPAAPAPPAIAGSVPPPITDDLRPSDAAKLDLASKGAEAPPSAPVQRRFAPPPPALQERSAVNGATTRALASNNAIAGAGAGAPVAKTAPAAAPLAAAQKPLEAEDKDQLERKRAKKEASETDEPASLPAAAPAPRPLVAPTLPPPSAPAHAASREQLALAPSGRDAKLSDATPSQTLESQAGAALASGRLPEAAALYLRAGRAALHSASSRDATGASANAANAAADFLSAIRCHLALGHIAEAKQARAELATISPPQPDTLAQADAAIATASTDEH